MIEALIDGERRGRVLADLAIGRMRTAGKLADLSRALTGRFTDHHAALCRLHLDRIALFNTAVAGLEAKIAVKVTPHQRELDLLKSIDGFGDAVAQAWLAEIGPAPHEYFGSHEKLASWVTLCPGNHMSAGVDGTFIWTPSHDQRPCSFSTAPRGCDPCRPGAVVQVERPAAK